MANIKNNASAQETRKLLLQAAGEIFAERGFHLATIKEITERAHASLASVNYHFRDKAELYAAVIRQVIGECGCAVPPDDFLAGEPPERLRQFIQHFLTYLMSRDKRGWEKVLMSREMSQQSTAFDSLITCIVQPLHDRLAALAAEIAGTRLSPAAAGLITSSIVGQCLHYADHTPIILRMYPHLSFPRDIDVIADHIATFSIAAIRATAAKSPSPRPRRAPLRAAR